MIYKKGLIEFHNNDCNNLVDVMSEEPLIFLDPPFQDWDKVREWPNATKICFTNFQNREKVTDLFGTPRSEIIWFFKDGRWTSHNMPRTCHENILIYGNTGEIYVAEENKDRTPIDKGINSIGSDKLEHQLYTPRERKGLNSVQEFPRNVSGDLGVWGKPYLLIWRLLKWADVQGVADPYAGSGVVARVADDLGIKSISSEIKTDFYNKAVDNIKNSTPDLFSGI